MSGAIALTERQAVTQLAELLTMAPVGSPPPSPPPSPRGEGLPGGCSVTHEEVEALFRARCEVTPAEIG